MTVAAVLLAAALLISGRPREVSGRRCVRAIRQAGVACGRLGRPGRRVHVRRVRRVPDIGDGGVDRRGGCRTVGPATAGHACSTGPPTCWRSARIPLRHGRIPLCRWTITAEALLRLARRSAASGAALAQGVADLADQSRHDAASAADARAQRASVLIAGPLGLCYLPAFVCLGIVPIVAGLAGDVLRSGLI